MNGIRMQKVGGKWRFLPIAAYCTAERWPIRLAVVRVGVVGKRREQQCEARGGWMDGWKLSFFRFIVGLACQDIQEEEEETFRKR